MNVSPPPGHPSRAVGPSNGKSENQAAMRMAMRAASGTSATEPSSIPVVSTHALGGKKLTSLHYLTAAETKKGVRGDTERAAWPDYRNEFSEVYSGRARAEVQSASALPIEPEKYETDRWSVEGVSHLAAERDHAKERADKLQMKCESTAQELAGTPPPMPLAKRMGVALLIPFFALVTIVPVGLLLVSSVDIFLVRGYVESFVAAGGERYSAELSWWLSIMCAAGLLLPQALSVLLTWGRIGYLVKGLFIVSDLVFSMSFAAVRLGEHISFQAIAISGFEMALLLICSSAMIGISSFLRRDAERAERCRPVERRLKALRRDDKIAKKKLAELEAQLARHVEVLEERMDAARRAPLLAELAAVTAEAEYRTTVAEMMRQEAKNPADEVFSKVVNEHLREVAARVVSPNHEVRVRRMKA